LSEKEKMFNELKKQSSPKDKNLDKLLYDVINGSGEATSKTISTDWWLGRFYKNRYKLNRRGNILYLEENL
jgi:hypothetical protein